MIAVTVCRLDDQRVTIFSQDHTVEWSGLADRSLIPVKTNMFSGPAKEPVSTKAVLLCTALHSYLICWKTGGLSLTSPTWTMTEVVASTPAMLKACTTRK